MRVWKAPGTAAGGNEPAFDVDNRWSRMQAALFTLGVAAVFVLAVIPVHLLILRLFCILVFWSGLYHFLLAVELRRLLDLTREQYKAQLAYMGVDEDKAAAMRRNMSMSFEILTAPYSKQEAKTTQEDME